jgi:hypothetical protein
MDKYKLTGPNLGWVFNFRWGCMCAMYFPCTISIWPNLKLKTQPKQLLVSLPLDIALSSPCYAQPTLCFKWKRVISTQNTRWHYLSYEGTFLIRIFEFKFTMQIHHFISLCAISLGWTQPLNLRMIRPSWDTALDVGSLPYPKIAKMTVSDTHSSCLQYGIN